MKKFNQKMYAQKRKNFYNSGKWGDLVMLIKSLDDSMEKARRFERITRATRFVNNGNEEKEKNPEKEFMMLQKIAQYSKEETDIEELNSIEIVDEQENEEVPAIMFKGNTSCSLPFFRSIQFKLSEVFSV